MPDFEIAYMHKGRQRVAVLPAWDYRDAYEAFQSLKESGVISDEIVQVVQAPEIEIGEIRHE